MNKRLPLGNKTDAFLLDYASTRPRSAKINSIVYILRLLENYSYHSVKVRHLYHERFCRDTVLPTLLVYITRNDVINKFKRMQINTIATSLDFCQKHTEGKWRWIFYSPQGAKLVINSPKIIYMIRPPETLIKFNSWLLTISVR